MQYRWVRSTSGTVHGHINNGLVCVWFGTGVAKVELSSTCRCNVGHRMLNVHYIVHHGIHPKCRAYAISKSASRSILAFPIAGRHVHFPVFTSAPRELISFRTDVGKRHLTLRGAVFPFSVIFGKSAPRPAIPHI